ncbi:MAG: glycosyltransferase family 2 protein [Methyloversatilis discipulorum]|uniref:glycosyltransferase family 2 protein n=1 Tax=Methyloversatilis discipulorum TaxID=1119528 RepID=UPI0026EE9E92|nr:glycosyltransferase family 2 protein [Methyloversatilis discipulorum]MBT9517546.1 glycosyltransferase family 2 protein [Methyloversatilis discipulorum]
MNQTTPLPLSSARVTPPTLSVVVPAYNEAGALASTLDMISRHLAALVPHYEIVVVDDGSRDATAQIAADCTQRLPVTLVRFSRNFGKEAAISAGLQHARGDVVVCMDADGQHSADLLGTMLTHWREGWDMVYAVRADRAQQGLFNQIGSKLFYRMMNMGGRLDIPPNAGDFRLMDRRVVDALLALPERQRFMKGMYAWVGFRSIGIPYTPLPRAAGETSFNRLNLMRLAWTGLTSFSVLPLRMASLIGLLLSSIAFAYGLYIVVEKMLLGVDVPGWPTVVVSIMFFSGVQLLFIGVLGEYLARVYEEVKGRPPYVVAEIVRSGDER